MIWLLTLLPILAFLFYASYSIRAGVYLQALCRVKTTERVVYLTFDDGPHSIQTPKILDVLKAHDVKATFFCIGSKIEGNEELLKRIQCEGHLLGNHSYSHSNFFPLLSKSKMIDDLSRCDEQLNKVLVKPNTLFRPPFGVTNPTIARVVKIKGYQVLGWNIRTLDTQFSNTKKVLQRIKVCLRPGAIILMHDRLEGSDILLDKVLDLLSQNGYRVDKLPNSAFPL